MNDKQQQVKALRDIYDRWQTLLASLSEKQITAPQLPDNWSVKDVVAHLRAWQQFSIARMQAARQNREPEFPEWSGGLYPDAEEYLEQFNATIYALYHPQPWADVRRAWQASFAQLVELAEAAPAQDLFDTQKYAWLEGYALADVLQGSFEHHEEHLDSLVAWLREHGSATPPDELSART